MMRMPPTTFEYILARIDHRIRKRDKNYRKAIPPPPPAERLTVALKFLATGESNLSLCHQFRMGKTTVSRIIKQTIKALYKEFRHEYLKVSLKNGITKTINKVTI